jgi:hypothetical protein
MPRLAPSTISACELSVKRISERYHSAVTGSDTARAGSAIHTVRNIKLISLTDHWLDASGYELIAVYENIWFSFDRKKAELAAGEAFKYSNSHINQCMFGVKRESPRRNALLQGDLAAALLLIARAHLPSPATTRAILRIELPVVSVEG